MSGIRGKDTTPELAIRKALHASGFRFRLHPKTVPGKPDLVLPKYRAAVFVHGCFWHGHDCPFFKVPDTRRDFWLAKIERNRARDHEVREQLAQAGWRRLVIWECALRGRNRLGLEPTVARATKWITGDAPQGEIRGTA